MIENGDIKFLVEYLDHAKGIAAIRGGGGDVDNDTMWDFCQQHEITAYRDFSSKWRAVAWAKRNKKLDVFHMPRIVEQTYSTKDRMWVWTGYWETDGTTEIDPNAYPRD